MWPGFHRSPRCSEENMESRALNEWYVLWWVLLRLVLLLSLYIFKKWYTHLILYVMLFKKIPSSFKISVIKCRCHFSCKETRQRLIDWPEKKRIRRQCLSSIIKKNMYVFSLNWDPNVLFICLFACLIFNRSPKKGRTEAFGLTEKEIPCYAKWEADKIKF